MKTVISSEHGVVTYLEGEGFEVEPEATFSSIKINSLPGYVSQSLTLTTNAPLEGGGDLSSDRTLSINQATATTDGYISKDDWNTFAAKMTNPMSQLGDIIYDGAAGAPIRLTASTSNKVLFGGTTPTWGSISEGNITLSDVTTLNASTGSHGFLPRLVGSSLQFLNSQGNWTVPFTGSAGGVPNGYLLVVVTGSTTKNVVHNFGTYPVVQLVNAVGLVTSSTSITHNSANDFTVVWGITFSGSIVASVGSPPAQSIINVNANYSASFNDRIIQVSAANSIIALPTAVNFTGREYIIDNASSGSITLVASGSQTINGQSTQTIATNNAINVYSNGLNWRIY